MKSASQILILLFLFVSSLFAQDDKSALLAKIQKARPDTSKIQLYREIIKAYEISSADSAVNFAREGLELSRKLNYKLGEAMMLNELGSINNSHGNLDLAKRFNSEALELFKELNYQQGIAAVNNGLGVVEGKKGNLKKATEYFLTALKINEKINNTEGIVQCYIKLGLVNEFSGNSDKALELYNKGQKLVKNIKPRTYVTLFNNIGTAYGRKGDLKKALMYFKEGIKKSDSLNIPEIRSSLLTNAGNASEQMGDLEGALNYHKKALETARKLSQPEETARAMTNMASVMYGLNRPQESLDTLNKALVIAKSIGIKLLTSEIFSSISSIYKDQKKYKEALEAIESEKVYSDSVVTLDKKKDISAMQSAYELDKSKTEIQNLELTNQKQKLQRNIFIIAIVATLIIVFILWLSLKRRNKLVYELQTSNNVKDKLFSIIAHDLRGPIGSVVQMLDILEEEDFPAEDRKTIYTSLKRHSEASLYTMDTLLDWGKMQLQGKKTKMLPFELKTVISSNIEGFNSQIIQKEIEVKDNTPDDLKVCADKDHVNFVMRNLLSNALKFTFPKGLIEINADEASDADFVIVSVKDNGKGISEDNQKKLFNFYVDSTRGTDDEKGTGIGLMICKEFIEANEGRIWVESDPGKGTTFFFTLKKRD